MDMITTNANNIIEIRILKTNNNNFYQHQENIIIAIFFANQYSLLWNDYVQY